MKNKKIDAEKEKWKQLIIEIKALARKKYGYGFRLRMYDNSKINRNRLTRFFQIKNPPRLDTIYTMLDDLEYEIVLKKKKKST